MPLEALLFECPPDHVNFSRPLVQNIAKEKESKAQIFVGIPRKGLCQRPRGNARTIPPALGLGYMAVAFRFALSWVLPVGISTGEDKPPIVRLSRPSDAFPDVLQIIRPFPTLVGLKRPGCICRQIQRVRLYANGMTRNQNQDLHSLPITPPKAKPKPLVAKGHPKKQRTSSCTTEARLAVDKGGFLSYVACLGSRKATPYSGYFRAQALMGTQANGILSFCSRAFVCQTASKRSPHRRSSIVPVAGEHT
jgi:hypothetical protein